VWLNNQNTDWYAFELGSMAWDLSIKGCLYDGNPFDLKSLSWYSWNKGWNTNFNGV